MNTREASNPWRAAFVELNITPWGAVRLQGMSCPPRVTDRVTLPLAMQLLLIEDPRGTRLLLVAADLFGFDPELVGPMRHIAANVGVAPERLLLNASHTHYGPGTVRTVLPSLGEYDAAYAETLVEAFRGAVRSLAEQLAACSLNYGVAQAQIGVNRRLPHAGSIRFAPNPVGYVETHTPFLTLESAGRRLVVVNHGCHPTGLSLATEIHADFPGYLRRALAAKGWDGVLFLQGAAGDVKQTVPGQIAFCGEERHVAQNGAVLAESVAFALSAGQLEPVTGGIRGALERVALPLAPVPDPERVRALAGDKGVDPLRAEWASVFGEMYPRGGAPQALGFDVGLVALGEVIQLLHLPGEPLAGLAKRLRHATGHPEHCMLLGYTNGLVGYLADESARSLGGYEIEATQTVYLQPATLAAGAERILVNAVETLVRTVGI